MTEHQKKWLSSTSPSELLDFIYPQATEQQIASLHAHGIKHTDLLSRPSWVWPVNQNDENICAVIRDVFGNPHRPVKIFTADELKGFTYGEITRLITLNCKPHEWDNRTGEENYKWLYSWLTPSVTDLARQIRNRVCPQCNSVVHIDGRLAESSTYVPSATTPATLTASLTCPSWQRCCGKGGCATCVTVAV